MKRASRLEPVAYPPGHFTALIRLHNWPPRWQPAYQAAPGPDRSAISTAVRDDVIARGGWSGTVAGISARSDARPGIRRESLLAHRRRDAA